MKKLIVKVLLLSAISLTTGIAVYAQNDAQYDQYIKLLRQDLREGKKGFIAENMELTPAESKAFWPVYDQYAIETAKLNDARLSLIKDYAAKFEKLTDADARSLNTRSIEIDAQTAKLRQKYVPLIGKVLPGKKSAFFFQLDKRLALILDLQLASEIPLVGP